MFLNDKRVSGLRERMKDRKRERKSKIDRKTNRTEGGKRQTSIKRKGQQRDRKVDKESDKQRMADRGRGSERKRLTDETLSSREGKGIRWRGSATTSEIEL